MDIKTVGVVGAGTIGKSIIVDLLINKMRVVAIDQSQDILEAAAADIKKVLRFLPLVKKMEKFDPDQLLAGLKTSVSPDALKDCDFIIENIKEDAEEKKALYKKLSNICREQVIFGVNTSCISITKIAGVTDRSANVIGMHFMNPSYLKMTVEVIRGMETSTECVDRVGAFLKHLGKDMVVVNDYPGFVSNRISHLFMNEAAFVVQDDVATPAQVDTIFKKCYGHPMGPLETADLIGIDTVVNSLNVLYESYQDSKYRCCPLLRKMVAAGHLGKKSGIGFYRY